MSHLRPSTARSSGIAPPVRSRYMARTTSMPPEPTKRRKVALVGVLEAVVGAQQLVRALPDQRPRLVAPAHAPALDRLEHDREARAGREALDLGPRRRELGVRRGDVMAPAELVHAPLVVE